MSRWADELGRIDWSGLRLSSGDASKVPSALISLADSSTREDGLAAYWQLDNSIVIQGNLFQAAEFVIPFVIALTIDAAAHVRELALELLIQLAAGEPHPSEVDACNGALGDRCRRAVRAGLASYYQLLDSTNDELRDRALELIGIVEEDRQRKLWTMYWIEKHDPNPKIRKLAERIARQVI